MSQGCATWRDDLGAYVIGALDREERAAMRRHLAACPACRTDYEDLLPVRDWLTRTKRHLAACPACRTDYEDLLHLRLAINGAAGPETGPEQSASAVMTLPPDDLAARKFEEASLGSST